MNLFLIAVSRAEESGEGERPNTIELKSTIVGNQEQPEVIHIVPWQTINAPAPNYNPLQRFMEHELQILDRREMQRKIQVVRALDKAE
jgi:hypothetical protein